MKIFESFKEFVNEAKSLSKSDKQNVADALYKKLKGVDLPFNDVVELDFSDAIDPIAIDISYEEEGEILFSSAIMTDENGKESDITKDMLDILNMKPLTML